MNKTDVSQKKGLYFLILLSIFFGGIFLLYLWSAFQFQDKVTEALQYLQKVSDISEQKTRQEAISIAIKNAQDSLLIYTLIGRISAGFGVTITLASFIFGLIQYIDIRKKEHSQTTANIFSKLWEGIAEDNPKVQASSIIGFADFLSENSSEYSEGTIAALALVGKIHNLERLQTEEGKDDGGKTSNLASSIAEGALKRTLERAIGSHPDTFKLNSWQGIKCCGADFSGERDLTRADFRDSYLNETDFSKLTLIKARFDAACLIGAIFKAADLREAQMQYADLTEANFEDANLGKANLRNAKILNVNLKGADLRQAKISLYSTDWKLAANWRQATWDDNVISYLLAKYGPVVESFRILMLLWEYPSYVTGGGWTAAYHFIRKMRKKGANIIVLVPWPKEYISPYAFGNEIEVYPVGDRTTQSSLTDFSGYKSVYSSVYLEESEGESQYYASSRFKVINDFTNRALQELYEKNIKFDVIHADDWLTFPAAQRISQWAKKPWVAHFHSTEYERRPEPVNAGISRIERKFSRYASKILVPGSSTKKIITEKYGAEDSKVVVVPNCFSESEIEEAGLGSEALGEFHTQKVIFAGRLQWQKGIDIFLDIAKKLSFIRPGTHFSVYGRGEHDFVVGTKNTSTYKTTSLSGVPLIFDNTVFQSVDLIDAPINSNDFEKNFYIWKIASVEVTVTKDNKTEYKIIQSVTGSEEKNALWHQIRARGFDVTNTDNAEISHYPFLLKTHDVGDGFHRDYLIRISGQLGNSQYNYTTKEISFKGFTRWEKRSSVFQGASVCVVPSRFEPFGMIVLEAMCHGVPVIYPKESGVAEVIKTGFAVDFSNQGAIIETISNLLDDMDWWEQVVQEQSKEIEKYFEGTSAEQLRELLGEVAKQSIEVQ